MTSLNFLADLEKDTPLENSVMISNRSLQNAAAEIASLKAELEEAREIIGEFIGPGKFYGEDHGAEGTTPFHINWNTIRRARSFLNKENKSVKMEFNVCEHCGARDGRAGNLISSQSLMNGAHLCMNCHDTAKSGNFVIHAYLERTDEELKKTSLLLQDQQHPIAKHNSSVQDEGSEG